MLQYYTSDPNNKYTSKAVICFFKCLFRTHKVYDTGEWVTLLSHCSLHVHLDIRCSIKLCAAITHSILMIPSCSYHSLHGHKISAQVITHSLHRSVCVNRKRLRHTASHCIAMKTWLINDCVHHLSVFICTKEGDYEANVRNHSLSVKIFIIYSKFTLYSNHLAKC